MPTSSIIGTRWLIDYVSQGVAAPLDDYLTPSSRARFIDTFLSPSVMDGKTYGLPIAASARAMYYNKDLFEKAGITEPPANWDELKAAAEKIKALGGDVYGFGLQGKEIETDVYCYYAHVVAGRQDPRQGRQVRPRQRGGATRRPSSTSDLIDERPDRAGRHLATTARTCRTCSSRAGRHDDHRALPVQPDQGRGART